MSDIPCIMAIDDDSVNLTIISEYLANWDVPHSLEVVNSPVDAWNALQNSPADYDIILLDRMMPEMDGMDLLNKIKTHEILNSLPVILQTAKNSKQDIIEGMEGGAYYYLTKPFDRDLLLSILKTTINERLQKVNLLKKLNTAHLTFPLLSNATFKFRTYEDADNITAFIASLTPTPEKVAVGLYELFSNAIEHGNLEIGYDDKTRLENSNCWQKEIKQRMQDSRYSNRQVEFKIECSMREVRFTIIDEGKGFDAAPYMDFDPNRIQDNHGRGIAMANKTCFSSLEYIGSGNTAVATIALKSNK